MRRSSLLFVWVALTVLLSSTSTAALEHLDAKKRTIEEATISLAERLMLEGVDARAIEMELTNQLVENDAVFGSAFCFNPSTSNVTSCPFAFRDVSDPRHINTLDIADFIDYTEPEYYAAAVQGKNGRSIWTQPYVDVGGAGEDICMMTYSVPVILRGELFGVLTGDLLLASVEVSETCVLTGLLDGYEARSAPSEVVHVSTGLYDVYITEFRPFDSMFDTLIWMRFSWHDPRLQWNPNMHNDTIEIDKTEVWYPKMLTFENQLQENTIFESPAIIDSSGLVEVTMHIRATFLCQTDHEIRRFPFDEHQCYMKLGYTGHRLKLDYDHGFQIISHNPTFAMKSSVTKVETQEGETILYGIHMTRLPFASWVRLILPAILINLVGFMVFWITLLPVAVALGITALLCTLAFRDTVSMPDTADITWSEVLVLINVTYQALVMFIIFMSHCPVGAMINQGAIRLLGDRGPWAGTQVNWSALCSCWASLAKEKAPTDDKSAIINTKSSPTVEMCMEYSQPLQEEAPQAEEPGGCYETVATNEVDVDELSTDDCLGWWGERNGTNNPSSMSPLCQQNSSTKHTNVKDPSPMPKVEQPMIPRNVNWIGRYFIIPSYILVMIFMLALGPHVF